MNPSQPSQATQQPHPIQTNEKDQTNNVLSGGALEAVGTPEGDSLSQSEIKMIAEISQELNSSQEEIGISAGHVKRYVADNNARAAAEMCKNIATTLQSSTVYGPGLPPYPLYNQQFANKSQMQVAHQFSGLVPESKISENGNHLLELQVQQQQVIQHQTYQHHLSKVQSTPKHGDKMQKHVNGFINQSLVNNRMRSTNNTISGCRTPDNRVPGMSYSPLLSNANSSTTGIYKGVCCGNDNIVTSTPVTNTTASGMTSLTMPTTTVVTATTALTAAINRGQMEVLTTATVCTTTTVTTTCASIENEGKRKGTTSQHNGTPAKRRIVGAPNRTKGGHSKDSEDQDIKSMFRDIKSFMNGMNEQMAEMRRENGEWKGKIQKLEEDCNSLKESVNVAHNMLQDEVHKRTIVINDIKQTINQQASSQTSTAKIVNTHSDQIRTLNDSVRRISRRLDQTIEDQRMQAIPVQQLKVKVEESLGEIDFPIRKTLIAQGVWYRENEDLDKVAVLIISTLGIDDVKVVKTCRMSGKESGSGTVKIKVGTENELKKILKEKKLLKDANAPELRDIYLRPARSSEAIVAEKNQDTILRELGVRDNYVRLQSGHLTRKHNRYRKAEYQCGGRGKRGGRRGRGGFFSHQNQQSTASHPQERQFNTDKRKRNVREGDVPIESLL